METGLKGLLEDTQSRIKKIEKLGLTFKGWINENAPNDDPPVGIIVLLFTKSEGARLETNEIDYIEEVLKENQETGSDVTVREFDGDSVWVTQLYYY